MISKLAFCLDLEEQWLKKWTWGPVFFLRFCFAENILDDEMVSIKDPSQPAAVFDPVSHQEILLREWRDQELIIFMWYR